MKVNRRLDLQSPLQARHWLKLLVEDPNSGFRLLPNLDLAPGRLGFSVRTNRLGLRGPSEERASNVILGTSFAMGIAVDNGANWYEVAGLNSDWLNLGLPVGIHQWAHLMSTHHRGPKSRVVLLYHPNFWVHCMMYERWLESKTGLFSALRWRTGWFECCWLEFRRAVRRRSAQRKGLFLHVEHNGEKHPIEALQSRIDSKGDLAMLVDRNMQRLVELVEPFQELILVRVPIKIELVSPKDSNEEVRKTQSNFRELWELTRRSLTLRMGAKRVVVCDASFMGLHHFHPRDSHWNQMGNKEFGSWIQPFLS